MRRYSRGPDVSQFQDIGRWLRLTIGDFHFRLSGWHSSCICLANTARLEDSNGCTSRRRPSTKSSGISTPFTVRTRSRQRPGRGLTWRSSDDPWTIRSMPLSDSITHSSDHLFPHGSRYSFHTLQIQFSMTCPARSYVPSVNDPSIPCQTDRIQRRGQCNEGIRQEGT